VRRYAGFGLKGDVSISEILALACPIVPLAVTNK
jgi:hypothetical protein